MIEDLIKDLIGVDKVLEWLGKWLKENYGVKGASVETDEKQVVLRLNVDDPDRIYKDLMYAMNTAGLLNAKKIRILLRRYEDGEGSD